MTRRRVHHAERSATILNSDQTCWRQAPADSFAIIIDAADYFSALKTAMKRAEKSVFLIGWDFDFRIHLDSEGRDDNKIWPGRLVPKLKRLFP